MKRKALIIYCTNTKSNPLPFVAKDEQLLRNYLMSNTGGDWRKEEILSLENPKIEEVRYAVESGCKNVDYSFVVFTGHGCIDYDTKRQVLEIADGDITLADLVTPAARQTLIIDACRGYVMQNAIQESRRLLFCDTESSESTRNIFDNRVMEAEEGLTILYSASDNQTSGGNDDGSAYIYSLVHVCKEFGRKVDYEGCIDLKEAHDRVCKYLKEKFKDPTIQKPTMNIEKRSKYFPIAVKHILKKFKKPAEDFFR